MNISCAQIKELLFFFDILLNLPRTQERYHKKQKRNKEKIPVILSSDNNYCPYLAVAGASILYNTNSFIAFYILCDGIKESSKALIAESFQKISSNFSLEFIDISGKELFSSVELREGDHVSVSTCNRLLIPKLLPTIDRAIYLDVDVIVLKDIRNLWQEDLEGHIFGAVPLVIDRYQTTVNLRGQSHIPSSPPHDQYKYFNSGVMLIDYKKWRKLKGSNDEIVKDLLSILKEINPKCTPDECVLNRFAFVGQGYKELPHKYNCHTYFSYRWLEKQSNLTKYELGTLQEFKKHINHFHFQREFDLGGDICIRHFFAIDKPWNSVAGKRFPMPIMPHLQDYWFYASLTKFFDEIRVRLLNQLFEGSRGDMENVLKQWVTTMQEAVTQQIRGDMDSALKQRMTTVQSALTQQIRDDMDYALNHQVSVMRETVTKQVRSDMGVIANRQVGMIREVFMLPEYRRKLKRIRFKILFACGARRQRYLRRKRELKSKIKAVEQYIKGSNAV